MRDAHATLVQAVTEMTAAVEACVETPSTTTCVDALTEPTPATLLENEWIDAVMQVADEL